MGPLTHLATTRLARLPLLSGVWMDMLPSRRLRELSHGLPGLVAASIVGSHPAALGWALHVALDTVSHEPDRGAHGRLGKVWLP